MVVSISFHTIITRLCFADSYECGVLLRYWQNTTEGTTNPRLSARDSEEPTTMKLDIESQFETEIIAESGQNGE